MCTVLIKIILCLLLEHFEIITVRKRSLRRLCFYTCLSVILSTGGGGMHGRGHVWWGGHAWQGGVHGRAPMPPSPQILRDTVNERAVRILLERILVRHVIWNSVHYFCCCFSHTVIFNPLTGDVLMIKCNNSYRVSRRFGQFLKVHLPLRHKRVMYQN